MDARNSLILFKNSLIPKIFSLIICVGDTYIFKTGHTFDPTPTLDALCRHLGLVDCYVDEFKASDLSELACAFGLKQR